MRDQLKMLNLSHTLLKWIALNMIKSSFNQWYLAAESFHDLNKFMYTKLF